MLRESAVRQVATDRRGIVHRHTGQMACGNKIGGPSAHGSHRRCGPCTYTLDPYVVIAAATTSRCIHISTNRSRPPYLPAGQLAQQ
jgi:hypothetical protein